MEARKLSQPQPLPFELSLRIRHPSIDPAELSRGLAMEAKHSFRAGEPRRSRGDPASVHGESYWLGALDLSSWPADAWFAAEKVHKAFTQNLGWALALSAKRLLHVKALFERIRLEGGEVCLLVALAPAAVKSFGLAPEVSRVFSDLGIALEFDLTSE